MSAVAKALTDAWARATAAICYLGWTQHSKGVQISPPRPFTVSRQRGRPGGGILALRGHASIQGSTDIPTLYDILPGYLAMPRAGRGERTLAGWLGNNGRETGWWCHLKDYAVSLLKAYYGRRATAANDWGWGWLPRVTRDHSHFSYWTEMADGEVEGVHHGADPSVGPRKRASSGES